MQQPNFNHSFRVHPTQLGKRARASHVLESIFAYNEGIIKNNPREANDKFQRLQLSPFTFMRGTADLMYQDMAGTDGNQVLTLCVGDVHLENFGIMETDLQGLTWGINDFDEASFAPFTWDLKRGATSIFLAALENQFPKKEARKLTRSFVKSYLKSAKKGLSKQTTDYLQIKLIQDLIQSVQNISPSEWLRERYLDLDASTPSFKSTDEVLPLPRDVFQSKKKHIQNAIDEYLVRLKQEQNNPPCAIKILDLATKSNSGTASRGLWRYYILAKIERDHRHEAASISEDVEEKADKTQTEPSLIILEMKQTRPSVLAPYTCSGPLTFPTEGERIAYAEYVHLQNANPFYGYTSFENKHYLVRQRSAFKKSYPIEQLDDFEKFKSYTIACGKALAHGHLLSNAASPTQSNSITSSVQKVDTYNFTFDITEFAIEMAKQVTSDWKSFVKIYKDKMFFSIRNGYQNRCVV